MIAAEPQRYSPAALREFSARAFLHFGVPDADARLAAEILSSADLRGIDSHGVARLHTYFDMLSLGRINPKPKIRVVRESPSTATVDGDNGLGLVVGPKANEIAMAKAAEAGTGWVSVSNTNHFGVAGWYALQRARARPDRLGDDQLHQARGAALGAERMLGTNPIAIAFPGLAEPPIVIDLASSACAYGRIEMARRGNTKIPRGWAIDREGRDTEDPNQMIDGGAMLPLGSTRDLGGTRATASRAMVDILCCVLSGANWGPVRAAVRAAAGDPGAIGGKGDRPLLRRHADRRVHRSPTSSSGRSTTGSAPSARRSRCRAPRGPSSPATRSARPRRSARKLGFPRRRRRRRAPRHRTKTKIPLPDPIP